MCFSINHGAFKRMIVAQAQILKSLPLKKLQFESKGHTMRLILLLLLVALTLGVPQAPNPFNLYINGLPGFGGHGLGGHAGSGGTGGSGFGGTGVGGSNVVNIAGSAAYGGHGQGGSGSNGGSGGNGIGGAAHGSR